MHYKPYAIVNRDKAIMRHYREGAFSVHYAQKPGTCKPCSVVRLQQNSSEFLGRGMGGFLGIPAGFLEIPEGFLWDSQGIPEGFLWGS